MCRLRQARNTELYVSSSPAGPKPRDTNPREQWLQLQGKEASPHPFLVLYFPFLVFLPCMDVNISPHPFAWKPHFQETTRRDAFPTLGQPWETTGFSSAIASQMLHSHLKHGDACQKPHSNARGRRWRRLGSLLQALAAKQLHQRWTHQVPASTQISSTRVDPFGKPRQNTCPI